MQKKSQSDYTNDVWWSVHAIHLYRPNNFRMSNVYIYTKPISSIIMLYGHTHKTIKSDRARSTHLLVTSAHLKRPFRMTRSRPLSSLYIYPTWKIYFFSPQHIYFEESPLKFMYWEDMYHFTRAEGKSIITRPSSPYSYVCFGSRKRALGDFVSKEDALRRWININQDTM